MLSLRKRGIQFLLIRPDAQPGLSRQHGQTTLDCRFRGRDNIGGHRIQNIKMILTGQCGEKPLFGLFATGQIKCEGAIEPLLGS